MTITQRVWRGARWAMVVFCGAVFTTQIAACAGAKTGDDDDDSSSSKCQLGRKGCACALGNACAEGLACDGNRCVDAGAGGTGAGGTGAGGTGAGGTGAGGTGGVTCAQPGDYCADSSACCQTGSKVGPYGSICLKNDYVCHAMCSQNSECASGCCAGLNGTTARACADSIYCQQGGSGGSGGSGGGAECVRDLDCGSPGGECSVTCYYGQCVWVCG
jgi:hypothetical protein